MSAAAPVGLGKEEALTYAVERFFDLLQVYETGSEREGGFGTTEEREDVPSICYAGIKKARK